MPSHIFLQLGMWPEAAASNEASWAASVEWVKRRDLPISKRDYHSLHWLMYIYLQQGRYDKAKESLTLMRGSLGRSSKDDPRDLMFGAFTNAQMAATYVAETERWDAADQLLPRAETEETKPQAGGAPVRIRLTASSHGFRRSSRAVWRRPRKALPRRKKASLRCGRSGKKRPV